MKIKFPKPPNLALGIKDRNINDEDYHNAETMNNAWSRDSVFTLSYYADEGIYCIKHKASLKNAKLKDVEWTTTDENVAIVVGNGIVVAVGKGTAEIHTTSGGCTDSCLVKVK